jgi:uncharacterized membrane protein YeaQ/YmgE (transglycosylase-associated protein family)
MEGFGWIMTIILGGLAGWIAEKVMKFDTGLIMNIVLGIVGAVVGNFLLGLLGIGLGGIDGAAYRGGIWCLRADLCIPGHQGPLTVDHRSRHRHQRPAGQAAASGKGAQA